MKDVRALGLSRAAYETPQLTVVAVELGRLVSCSQWSAQAFHAPGAETDWGLSSAQWFLGGGESSWGGLPGVDGFEAQAFHAPEPESDWVLSSAQGFLGGGESSWGGLPGVDGFEAQAFQAPGPELDWTTTTP